MADGSGDDRHQDVERRESLTAANDSDEFHSFNGNINIDDDHFAFGEEDMLRKISKLDEKLEECKYDMDAFKVCRDEDFMKLLSTLDEERRDRIETEKKALDKLRGIKIKYDRRQVAMKQQMESLTKDNLTLQYEVERMQKTIAEQNVLIDDLHQRNDELVKDAAKVAKLPSAPVIYEPIVEFSSLKKENLNLKEKMTLLEEETLPLKKLIDEEKQRVSEAIESSKALEASLKEIKLDLRVSQREAEKSQKMVDYWRGRSTELREKIMAIEETAATEKDALSAKDDEIRQLQEKITKFENKEVELTKQFERQKIRLEERIIALEDQCKRVKQEKHQAETAVAYDTVKVYHTEGTPLNFSTWSSLTNLSEIVETVDKPTKPVTTVKPLVKVKPIPPKKPARLAKQSQAEAKASSTPSAVEQEATPLVFSRSSSLGSLSSFDMNFAHDDRSSLISEFSRQISEAVSPSDLPDSPGQTQPASPKPTFSVPTVRKASDDTGGVFADSRIEYIVEGTPFQISRATSLSDLTNPAIGSDVDDKDDDDELLEDCISSGMPKCPNNENCNIYLFR